MTVLFPLKTWLNIIHWANFKVIIGYKNSFANITLTHEQVIFVIRKKEPLKTECVTNLVTISAK